MEEMKIVPAILMSSIDECSDFLRLAKSFTNYVQIDIMDGLFVPTISFPPEALNGISTALSFELHLMVRNPLSVVRGLTNGHIRKIIFHIEARNEH